MEYCASQGYRPQSTRVHNSSHIERYGDQTEIFSYAWLQRASALVRPLHACMQLSPLAHFSPSTLYSHPQPYNDALPLPTISCHSPLRRPFRREELLWGQYHVTTYELLHGSNALGMSAKVILVQQDGASVVPAWRNPLS